MMFFHLHLPSLMPCLDSCLHTAKVTLRKVNCHLHMLDLVVEVVEVSWITLEQREDVYFRKPI